MSTAYPIEKPQPIDSIGLDSLGRILHQELACLGYPAKNWVPARESDGTAVTDVVIVGGGMCGMLAWLALQKAGVRNVRIIDQSSAGFEGPWLTYARMETLRSPKQLTGPAYGLGALTFQAWFRAQFGAVAWEALDKIPRPMWMDYLRWYRKVLAIPVENKITLIDVSSHGNLLRLQLSGSNESEILCRKLIYATGREGTGRPTIPDFVNELASCRWAHSADDIDFAALQGKRVAVVGVGASAVENAAEALEAGALEVRLLIRRKEMPTINKMMGIGSYGLTAGFPQLPDEWRWRFMQYSFRTQTPAPRGSTLRVSRHANAYFHFDKGIAAMTESNHEITIEFQDGTSLRTDYVILGTGFTIDPLARSELGSAAAEILLWKHVYTPPPDEQSAELGLFPYLSQDFSFRERVEGKAPWLQHIYCFNYAATASLGKISGDIPAVSDGARLLVKQLAAQLYAEDIQAHWQILQEYDKPELQGDEWKPSAIN